MSEENKAKEPGSSYNTSSPFRHYTSFKEMNEGDALEMSKYTPEEHLMHVTELIRSVYAEELSKPFNFRKTDIEELQRVHKYKQNKQETGLFQRFKKLFSK